LNIDANQISKEPAGADRRHAEDIFNNLVTKL
jgi:hypothetical protein